MIKGDVTDDFIPKDESKRSRYAYGIGTVTNISAQNRRRMESARLTDLKRRASALIDAYQSMDHATFNHWFIEAVEHVQQLLREQRRSKPFFTLAEDWTWIQNATKEKASENYGARLLLDNWPTRLLREAEMLESRVIPDHLQLR